MSSLSYGLCLMSYVLCLACRMSYVLCLGCLGDQPFGLSLFFSLSHPLLSAVCALAALLALGSPPPEPATAAGFAESAGLAGSGGERVVGLGPRASASLSPAFCSPSWVALGVLLALISPESRLIRPEFRLSAPPEASASLSLCCRATHASLLREREREKE